MLYRLYHRSGLHKNAYRDEASKLMDAGGWYDNTVYKTNEDKKYALFKRVEREESKYERCEQRSNENLHSKRASKTGLQEGQSGRPEKRKCSEKRKDEQEVNVLKKKRGRPPKIKVPSDAAN